MSEIVDTGEGSFRRVTDGQRKWWLWECPKCQEWQPIDLDKSKAVPCSKCGHTGHNLGGTLVAQMQARILMGEEPSHEEGQDHRRHHNGIDGP